MKLTLKQKRKFAASISEGDGLLVADGYMRRGGQSGTVVLVDTEGVALDFYSGPHGEPHGVPSIEFWEWGELNREYLRRVIEENEQRRVK